MSTTSTPAWPLKVTATVPTPKIEEDFYDWYARHEAKVRAAAEGNHGIVFIGDSITHLFEGDAKLPDRGEKLWVQRYAKFNPLNLGFGYDRTQNVLWRLEHGEFAAQTPKLVVIMIGTNNLSTTGRFVANTPDQTAEGIKAICERIMAMSPSSRILLLGVFPRSAPDSEIRSQVAKINAMLEIYARGKAAITYMDIGRKFMDVSGRISLGIMNDGIHPTAAGYLIWADAIQPVVDQVMGSGA